MPQEEKALIVITQRDPTTFLPTFSIDKAAADAKAAALTNSALIGKVSDRDSKILAVRAQEELKRVINGLEKWRKIVKEPLLLAGNSLDDLVKREKMELEREFNRVTQIVSNFDEQERMRAIEEDRLKRLELERIERERQAEVKRLADEQAAKEAEARRVQEAAAKAARDAQLAADALVAAAKNKAGREAAEKAQREAQARQDEANRVKAEEDAKLAASAAQTAQQTALIEEKAGDAAYVAGRPVERTQVAGQRQNRDFEVVSMNEWTLLKARPDLVTKITFDMRLIKEELKRGATLPGVVAREVFTSGVRVRAERNAIDV